MVKLFRKHITPELSAGLGGGQAKDGSKGPGTALYVDTENLQGSAQPLIENIIERWPEGTPPPRRLNLYVQADRVSLWDIWATGRFPQLAVTVRGIQHFSRRQSKNSADIAIAIDAIADYVTDVAQFVAVMSDDSDFIPLYAKLKDLKESQVPFLWLVTDRAKTRSSTIKDYFPNEHVHVVSVRSLPAANSNREAPSSASSNASRRVRVAEASGPQPSNGGSGRPQSNLLEIVDLIIRRLPVGSFKSTDCQPVIRSRWPHDPMASMSSARFGTEFANKIWPVLEERGVKMVSTKPRKYGLTQEVKDSHRNANGASKAQR